MERFAMIRLMFNTIGGLMVKLLMLVIATNFLFFYLQDQPIAWSDLVQVDGLPNRIGGLLDVVPDLLRNTITWVREVSG